MVNWQSQEEVIKDGVAFGRFMHALLGLYIWEWFTSLNFDWQFISGKKKFRWPMIFYFLNRYVLLVALIGIAVALNVTSEVDCQALYTFNQCLGNAAIGLASINLSLRTMAVWNQNKYLVAFLVLVILGHWSLLLHGILLTAQWVTGIGCVISGTNNKILAISFIYTMVFDFTVLCLTAYKLLSPRTGRSQLVKLIFHDGLIYFLIAFLANLLATIFMMLNLNAVMSIIANVPAAIASTIVACRVVRRLNQFSSQGPEVFPSGGTQNSTLAFRSMRPKVATKSEGVHVQMETYQESPVDPDKTPYLMDDAGGQETQGVDYDTEAQRITGDFKRPPY
ncbi:hypothetical protein AGABI1DRAFT_115598 [Agaricus bisporus var. burnettii JB137-S8]|uniref:Transmembrane protein n=2 Tax=Agaricus bisporus var. burnettii TaxID=192524 RepID=K5X0R8_AGABU|nr:hypothetical protein AGABI2DRAFT_194109 [Agaricus bisporus var. bisporus H97]XP_007332612.1 uncharacterized protein AGABI1DRAFT_115598 [Agaricus bisporus var. burnettii JB137-S8]EKM76703.1 hypothetical protein AGABI1DRAFT_115598 [Agaricus bisporus var. burnettii JB137-S8]EKV45075.1 hypothetical protein AGABI2DRAFT_194109 [Agaricus bisporus var. bisporus H97]KAF7763451.1 hypothetical protein Agabi119p4_7988 [Agaricus bisporus var. burnettii]